jgi:hypothetical protein
VRNQGVPWSGAAIKSIGGDQHQYVAIMHTTIKVGFKTQDIPIGRFRTYVQGQPSLRYGRVCPHLRDNLESLPVSTLLNTQEDPTCQEASAPISPLNDDFQPLC